MTSGHCEPGAKIRLEGKPFTIGKEFLVSKSESKFEYNLPEQSQDGSLKYSDQYLAPNPNNGYLRPTSSTLGGKKDWGLLVLDFSGFTADEVLEKMEYINKHYTIRDVGNPGSVRIGNTVMVAGFGRSLEDDGIIGLCSTETSTCIKDGIYNTSYDRDWINFQNDVNKRYAFFQINMRGINADGFLFTSKAELTAIPQESWIGYEFDLDIEENSSNPQGLLAKGDSGGPVLNGNLQIVGVVQGGLQGTQIPYGFWNVFSSFNYRTVIDSIRTPTLYISPDVVQQGSGFSVFGQNIDRMEFKSEEGRSMAIAACTDLTEAQLNRINTMGLVLGVDYQCYKAPAVPGIDRLYSFKSRKTGDVIKTVLVRGRHTVCETKVDYYDLDNGQQAAMSVAFRGSNGVAFQGEFSDLETLAETKSRSIADAVFEANEWSTWATENIPYYYGETCTGGTDGDGTLEAATAVANMTVWDYYGTRIICAGGGVVHTVIPGGTYKLGKTTCRSDY